MDQDNRPSDSFEPKRGGDPARPVGPQPSDGLGLEAEALSPDERRTLASLHPASRGLRSGGRDGRRPDGPDGLLRIAGPRCLRAVAPKKLLDHEHLFGKDAGLAKAVRRGLSLGSAGEQGISRARSRNVAPGPDTVRPAAHARARSRGPRAASISLESRERALDREQEALDREADRLSDRKKDRIAGDREDLGRRRRALEERMRGLEKEQEQFEELESSLEEKQEALEREAERELWLLIDSSVARGIAKSID